MFCKSIPDRQQDRKTKRQTRLTNYLVIKTKFCEDFFRQINYCEITTASAEKYLLPRSASLTEFWALGGWELERAPQSALLLLLLRLRAYQRISEYYAAFSASVEILHFWIFKLTNFQIRDAEFTFHKISTIAYQEQVV